MKAVILAGGLGTRLAEETSVRPKPMVEVGGMPILWHIMKIYSYHGVNDFVVCCGYKGYMIKEYFANYFLHMSDVTFDLRANKMFVHQQRAEPWNITLVDTGDASMTGGRLLRVKDHLKDEDDFCLTYGDGVSDVNILKSIEFHRSHGRAATLTSTYPPGRFGLLEVQEGQITNFREKPRGNGGVINGGFFVLSSKVFSYLKDDDTVLENEPLARLAEERELMAFQHDGFWHPMDTLRDKQLLDNLWASGKAPWKKWE
jgi:glucose-1-phosphate cytidylyltransferase